MPVLKRCLFALFLIVCCHHLSAQDKQAPFKLFFEKVYLHTDRDLYTQGDTIWYKAYLVNARNNQSIGTSGNLYVELIQQDSAKLLNRQIIRMDYGIGNGDLILSDSIPQGKYIIRAYTNWMRNFGDNFIFEKEISILNTNQTRTNAANKPERGTIKALIPLNAKVKTTVNQPLVRFYPESGSLVEGISSIVAVKAEDRLGKGIPASGAVLSSLGDTVAHFNCNTLGMGLFALMPLPGQKYHAQITSGINKEVTVDLPQPLIKGFSLRVSHADSAINIIVNCNDAQLANAKGKTFTLTGKHDGKTHFNKTFQVSGNQTLISASYEVFTDGITAVDLTDDQNKPHCERLVYIHHKANVVTIQTDKTAYQPKEKVTVNIKTNGGKANLSMAVVDETIVPVQAGNIESYLMLTSELKGKIEHPGCYFDTTNTNRNKQLDMLLMTQGWRDFIWRRLADSALRVSYKVEDGFDVTGRVRQKFGDKPIKDINITLSAFKAKGQKLYTSRTDSAGKYAVNDLLLYGPQSIKLTARNDKGERSGWLLMDSVNNTPLPVYAKPAIEIDTTLAIIKAVKQLGSDRFKSSIKNGIKLKEVTIKEKKKIILQTGVTATEFGYPDKIYDITKKDEYYESLDNWLAHNVPGIRVAPDQGVILESGGGPSMSAIIVNGREIEPPIGKWTLDYLTKTDVNLVLEDDDKLMQQTIRQPYYNLSMDKVKKVVFRHLVGQDPDYGHTINVFLLYLTLVPNALDNKDFGFETANVDGYYQSKTFYKPQYNTPGDIARPDRRTTIHWEPNIITDANGEATVIFYNADSKTKIRIVVEGVKATGGPIVGSAAYIVK